MATEVENNVPAATAESKEVPKEDAPAVADNAKAAEEAAGKPAEGGDAAAPAAKEPVPPKVVVHKANFEKDVVYLYQFSRTPLLPSLSPYCLKVETWLRLAGLKYEVSYLLNFWSWWAPASFMVVVFPPGDASGVVALRAAGQGCHIYMAAILKTDSGSLASLLPHNTAKNDRFRCENLRSTFIITR